MITEKRGRGRPKGSKDTKPRKKVSEPLELKSCCTDGVCTCGTISIPSVWIDTTTNSTTSNDLFITYNETLASGNIETNAQYSGSYDEYLELMKQEEENIGLRDSVKECNCVDYEGQGWGCPEHTAKQECPKCNCVDTDILIPGLPAPSNQYRCRMCGVFYIRDMISGKYNYTP